MSKRRIQAPAGRTKAPSNRSYQGPVDATVKQRLLGHVRINCVCTKGAGTPIVRFMGQHAGAQPQTNESTEHRIERLLGELETEGQVEVERDGGQIVRVSLARPAQSQDAPAAVEAVHWEPKQAALRDLALIMLVDSGGELLSESGQVARLIRDHYGLPDVHTKSMSVVLRLMADDGLIT
ncbi:MAG TPA: hypothetical protein VLF67_05235, partial [Candidatus Saccharimonas sp.]|nr:hypothetical protein [Candidatus Saccharimonas sp.]